MSSIKFLSEKYYIFLFAEAYALLRAIQAFESKTAWTNLCTTDLGG